MIIALIYTCQLASMKIFWFFFVILKASEDANYDKFLDNLVNKRRQIADANPKNLNHFSGNSASSTSTHPAPNPLAATPAEYRPTKSIIIGAGQPIVIPGQKNITNDVHANNQTIAVGSGATAAALSAAQSAITQTNAIRKYCINVDFFCNICNFIIYSIFLFLGST